MNIQKIKKKIIKEAKAMSWVPAHLKEGRFKHNLENAPDWNLSRNRYWATPLPVWKCAECAERVFIGSREELKAKTKKSGNKYFVIRHGDAENNKTGMVSYKNQASDSLTAKGKKEVLQSAKKLQSKLQGKKIDLIITSDFIRAKETAEIVRASFKLAQDAVVKEPGLREMNPGNFDGGLWKNYHDYMRSFGPGWFARAPLGGESLYDVKVRTARVLYELEEKHKGKNILLLTHGAPAWLLFVNSGLFEPDHKEYVLEDVRAFVKEFKPLHTAEARALPFVPIPHDKNYELDFHRPYIDQVKLACKCGAEMTRVPEVLDSWFESGSMPFAQDHYPFKNPKWQTNNFPAGFVAEYIGQTRTWYYYTHVLSTILFGRAPFKNIITTGTLLTEDGQKISKSKKNYPDPWLVIDKYGVDALRIYLMASPLMKGEDANFSEKSVQEISSKVIGRLFNVVAFYELYPVLPRQNVGEYGAGRDVSKSKNILDRWILARLNQLIKEVTKGMEAYDMNEASRPISDFAEDLSTWYLRRSRERIKSEVVNSKLKQVPHNNKLYTGQAEYGARTTLCFVLKNFAKLLAPFAPFAAEDIWLQLRSGKDEESVHLSAWPKEKVLGSSGEVLEKMQKTREIVSLGLKERQKTGIPVRQPLALLKLKVKSKKLSSEYSDLVKEELNVKKVVFDDTILNEIWLDAKITPKLKQEGDYRELVRVLQDMRKEKGLQPSDTVVFFVSAGEVAQKLIREFKKDLMKIAGIREIKIGNNDGSEVKIGDLTFKIKIKE